MKKEVLVQFDSESYEEYKELQDAVSRNLKNSGNPTYEQLLTSINSALRNLKANPFYGDLIPKKNISKGVSDRYGTDKIFRVELVGYWRLLYTIVGDEAKIIAFILEYMDHEKYDKIFGYRKR
ncbi:MAG: hypothetical protein Q8O89_06610 [Nanoarchaeota archaeon]|nr:hypothetical protein [Nanoarchaeota archaeon]